MALYFPAPGTVSDYCNNPSIYNNVQSDKNLIPFALQKELEKTGRNPVPNDVKYIFYTKSGPGPIRQPISEALLDPATGSPVAPGPKHKRMNIAAADNDVKTRAVKSSPAFTVFSWISLIALSGIAGFVLAKRSSLK